MGIDRFLNHRVSIVRRVAALDEDDAIVLDDSGQVTVVATVVATNVAAGIQPRRAREVLATSQAGLASVDAIVYMHVRDISTADAIHHDPTACPLAADLPDAWYEVTSSPDAAGAGHHLELMTKLVGSPLEAAA